MSLLEDIVYTLQLNGTTHKVENGRVFAKEATNNGIFDGPWIDVTEYPEDKVIIILGY